MVWSPESKHSASLHCSQHLEFLLREDRDVESGVREFLERQNGEGKLYATLMLGQLTDIARELPLARQKQLSNVHVYIHANYITGSAQHQSTNGTHMVHGGRL